MPAGASDAQNQNPAKIVPGLCTRVKFGDSGGYGYVPDPQFARSGAVGYLPEPNHFITGVVGGLPNTRPIFYGCRSGLPDTRSIFHGCHRGHTRNPTNSDRCDPGAYRTHGKAEITLKTSLTPLHEAKNCVKEMISPKSTSIMDKYR